MADSPAERGRRFRAHKRGDHSLCDPTRCHRYAVTGNVTNVTDSCVPGSTLARNDRPPLSSRGLTLWREVSAGVTLKPAERVLLEEACRTADRLDRLDRILNGVDEEWMTFRDKSEDGSVVAVVINGALSEARQQQAVLKQLLSELRQSMAATPAGRLGRGSVATAQSAAKGGGAGVVDFAARVAQLRSQASG